MGLITTGMSKSNIVLLEGRNRVIKKKKKRAENVLQEIMDEIWQET